MDKHGRRHPLRRDGGPHEGSEPSRPHPNCNCTIELVNGYAARTTFWHDSHRYERSELEFEFIATYGYEIRCPDGSGQSGTVEVSRDYELIYQTSTDDDFCPAPLIV